MEQLKLYPIMPGADDYEKLIKTVEDLGLEYQVIPEPFEILNVSTGLVETIYMVGVVSSADNLIKIMRTMNYNFV